MSDQLNPWESGTPAAAAPQGPSELNPWETSAPSAAQTPQPSSEPSFAGTMKDDIRKALDMAATAAPVIAGVASGNPIDAMAGYSASQVPGLTDKVSQEAGGMVADKLGQTFPNHPVIGGVAGTAVAMAPAIAQAVGGMGALEAGKDSLPAVARGLLTSPEELGPAIQAGEEAVGIDSSVLPVRRGTIAKFPGLDGLPTNSPPPQAPTVAPSVYPKDTNTFINFARQRLDSLGDKLQPQELADYRTILNTMIKSGEVKAGTKPYALASQLYTDANSLFTEAITGRDDLNQVYKYAKMIPSIGDAVTAAAKKYGPSVVRGAMYTAGAGAAWEGIKHLF